jgi:hypothetical protein
MGMLNICVSALLLVGTIGQGSPTSPPAGQPQVSKSMQQQEVNELDKALDRLKRRLEAQRARAYQTRLDAQRLLFRDYLQYRQMTDEAEMYEAGARQTEAAIAELCERRAQLTNGQACPVAVGGKKNQRRG